MVGGSYFSINDTYNLVCDMKKKDATEARVRSLLKQGKLTLTSIALINILREFDVLTNSMLTVAMQTLDIMETAKIGNNPYRKEIEFLTEMGIFQKWRIVDEDDKIHSPNIYMLGNGAQRACDAYLHGPSVICGSHNNRLIRYHKREQIIEKPNYEKTIKKLAENQLYLAILVDIWHGSLNEVEYAYPQHQSCGKGYPVIGLTQKKMELVIFSVGRNPEEEALNFVVSMKKHHPINGDYKVVPVIVCRCPEMIGTIWESLIRYGLAAAGSVVFFTDDAIREHFINNEVLMLHKGYTFSDQTLNKLVMTLDMGLIL